jgi:hypothetical protein
MFIVKMRGCVRRNVAQAAKPARQDEASPGLKSEHPPESIPKGKAKQAWQPALRCDASPGSKK